MNVAALMTILHSQKQKVYENENIKNEVNLDNKNDQHEFGYDLESDLKELYGDDYESINEMRIKLFLSLENEPFEVKMLRNIIQNPVPISKDQFTTWLINKLNIYDKYNISFTTITNVEFIEGFVKKYHMKEVI